MPSGWTAPTRSRPAARIGGSCASSDGTLLNRYWDDRDIPREESYREDVDTAKAAGRPPEEVYRDLRAAAESGWDFSSRWLEDGRTLSTIRTTELVPVDLNSFMVQLETTLAAGLRSRAQAGEGGGVRAPVPSCARRRCGATCGMPTRASLPTTCGARTSRAAR